MSDTSLPSSVVRLLDLLDRRPFVRWGDLPPDLHNAVRIARGRGLVAAETGGWGPDVLQHQAYVEALNLAHWLTEAGRDALALHRERQADSGPAAGAEGSERTAGHARESLSDNEYGPP